MSENKEEKQTEEEAQDYPRFLQLLEEIRKRVYSLKQVSEATVKEETQKKIRELLGELFEGLTTDKYCLQDSDGKTWVKHLERQGEDAMGIMTDKMANFINIFLIEPNRGAVFDFWDLWASNRRRKTENDLKTLDNLALSCLSRMDEKIAYEFFLRVQRSNFALSDLYNLATTTYKNSSKLLIAIGRVLQKAREIHGYWSEKGQDLIVRGYILSAKDELKQEFLETVDKKLKQSKMELDNKVKGIEVELGKIVSQTEGKIDERIKEQERNSIRNFVQIIGIFAAIIAFIVTIVPTAVRLGGASIPVALAGLAIVTAGIILLLAMIFGNPEEKHRKRLNVGFWVAVGLLVIWLGFTAWLAIKHPNTLVTAKEEKTTTQPVQTNVYMMSPPTDTTPTDTTR